MKVKKKKVVWQCGDCCHNNGAGEWCSVGQKTIEICDKACKYFEVFADIFEEMEASGEWDLTME